MYCPVEFAQIKDTFFEARYNNFVAIIEFSAKYLNATKLCADSNKHLNHWLKTKINKTLQIALEKENIKPYKVVEDNGVAGIYCHNLIAPHLALWISVDCSVKTGTILDHFLTHEWQDRVRSLTRNIKQLTEYYESIINDWRDVVNQKNEMLEKTELEMAKLKKCDWKSTHAFTLIRVNSDDFLPYYYMSCARRHVNAALRRLRRKHPRAEVVFQQKQVPNDTNVFNLLKRDKRLQTKNRYFDPLDMTQDKLIDSVNDFCNTTNPRSSVASLNTYIV